MKESLFITEEARWQAVVANDSEADGQFYYAVLTTGIYCRPSCPSKLPKRTNVEFFSSVDGAERMGYRPCKRCRPEERSKADELKEKVIKACRIIEKSERPPKLVDLAGRVGLSPHHFHRQFKNLVGLTPKQYSSTHQSKRFQEELKESVSVTDAIYSAGYGSSSRVYESKDNHLAMLPKVYREGALGELIVYGTGTCYLGAILVAATKRGICTVEIGDDEAVLFQNLQKTYPKAQIEKGDAEFLKIVGQVVSHIEAPDPSFQLPLDIQGSSFQQRVWLALQQIKPGETLSYSQLAARIGKPKAARAVASACGQNKLAVIVPCHRVISKSGKAGGYRWGDERKKTLLETELQSAKNGKNLNKF